MAIKIAFVGKPGVGKTTIKKVIFEGIDPNELVLFPLEATIGTKYSIYDFMDLKLSLIDTPGQSMPILLEDEERQINVFENTDAIIYIFDYNLWLSNPSDVITDVKKIYSINKENNYGAKIFLYFHKIDLIGQDLIETINLLKTQITDQLEIPEELRIYFTSLHPNLIYTIYNALSDTLSSFSPDISNLKDIINKNITDLSRTICFVTNQNNNIIIQAMTKDFDTSLIYHLYDKIIQLSQSTEVLLPNKNRFNLIESKSKILGVMINNIKEFHHHFKNLIILSENLSNDNLIKIFNKIKLDLSNHYKSI